jgi:hypothetical protein
MSGLTIAAAPARVPAKYYFAGCPQAVAARGAHKLQFPAAPASAGATDLS